MRVTVTIAMVLLLASAQAARAWCVCADDEDHGHTAVTRSHHHDHANATESSHHSDDSDHHPGRGSSHCDCGPAQPLAAPDASSLPTGPRAQYSLAGQAAPIVFWASSEGFGGRVLVQARPPPFVGGISSTSPMSLSKLQI